MSSCCGFHCYKLQVQMSNRLLQPLNQGVYYRIINDTSSQTTEFILWFVNKSKYLVCLF